MAKFKIAERSTSSENPADNLVSQDTTSILQIKDAPSNMLPYGENSRIFARTYPYREIKLLSDSLLPLDKQYEILLKGITTEEFDKYDLTFHDFQWINVYRKLSALGSMEYDLPYVCPKCKKANTHRFTLSDIGFSTLDVPELPVKVEFYEIGTHYFSPLTIGKYIEVIRSDRLYVKGDEGNLQDTNGEDIRDPISIIAAMCIDLELGEAYELFSNASDRRDHNLMERIDVLLDHGMEPLKFKCSTPIEETDDPTIHPSMLKKCDFKLTAGLLGGESIIIPFRGDEQPIETRISFGGQGNS